MARKKRTVYTADELRALFTRLMAHRNLLFMRIEKAAASFREKPDIELALEIRDASTLMCMTMHCMNHFQTLIALAERSGGEAVPFLDECGLEG